MGRRRAIVLGAVHVLILLHVVHWLQSGSTLSPVEPSESMRALELGEINAGFLFFALSILSTAIFGRFLCGWGCHLVALQDMCAWMMKKIGIRPRPFRSRILLYAPLALALYMFVWPTFRRLVLVPLFDFPQHGTFPGFTNHLTTGDFWATFPNIWVAIPFLAICGFATVYLLGAKGFCTYGCPYGGFFVLADRVAPGRIRVTDACVHCGHCTAVCTSNVRVHEEVREFGMVVNPGCMKCMDCVSTCPNDALYFGYGRPATSKPTPRTGRFQKVFDLSAAEEAALGAVFLATFLAFRSVYDLVPLLMAMGIAACVTFLLWTVWRLTASPRVSIQTLKLKRGGRIRPIGWCVVLVGLFVVALTVQSGTVRVSRAFAGHWDWKVTVPKELLFAAQHPPLPPEILEAAEKASRHYARADDWMHGGLGLFETPEVVTRRAWMELVKGNFSEAAIQLRRIVESGGDPTRFDLARVLARAGDYDAATRELVALVAKYPAEPAHHRELARTYELSGNLERAVSELVILTNLAPDAVDAVDARSRLVEILERLGRPDEADRYR